VLKFYKIIKQLINFFLNLQGAQNQSGKPATPMNPWVVFGDQQRAGQYTILKCCTAITPITAMLFAGHWASPIQMLQLSQVQNIFTNRCHLIKF